MTFHLLGPQYSTTKYNRKSKKSKSKKLQKAHDDHEAWLKSMGVGKVKLEKDHKGKTLGLNKIPDYSSDSENKVKTSDKILLVVYKWIVSS